MDKLLRIPIIKCKKSMLAKSRFGDFSGKCFKSILVNKKKNKDHDVVIYLYSEKHIPVYLVRFDIMTYPKHVYSKHSKCSCLVCRIKRNGSLDLSDFILFYV